MRTTFLFVFLLLSYYISSAQFDEYCEVDFVNADYYDMHQTKSGKIFLCGYPGILHFSSDEGNTWHKSGINSNNLINSIDSYENVIISVGSFGFVLFSKDEGLTWNKADSITQNMLTDVVLIDKNRAMAFGNLGTIIKSNNGCMTWDTIGSPTKENIISAINLDNYIFFSTQSGLVYKTSNFGDEWIKCELPSSNLRICNFQVKNDNIYVICNSGVIESNDLGMNWNFYNIDLTGYTFGYIDNNNKLFTVGYKTQILEIENFNVIYKDTSLNSTSFPLTYTKFNKIIRLSEQEILACGNNNIIVKSIDDGKTWEFISYLNAYLDHGYNGITFLTDSLGFIGGYLEILYKTTDAGTTWKFYHDFENGINYRTISNITFFDTTNGLMVSSYGVNQFLKTKDLSYKYYREDFNRLKYSDITSLRISDKSFLFLASDINTNIPSASLEFYDYNSSEWFNYSRIDSLYRRTYSYYNENIYMGGALLDSLKLPEEPYIFFHGAIFISQDKGLGWQRIDFNNLSAITSIEFIGQDTIKCSAEKWKTGTMTYEKSYIVLSTDAGSTWSIIDSGSVSKIFKPYKINDKYLFRMAESGEIHLSVDDGITWYKHRIHPNFRASAVRVTKNAAYIIGRLSDTYYAVIRMKLKDKYVDVKETKQIESIPLCWLSKPYPNPANNVVNFEIVWAIKYPKEELKISFYNLYGIEIENPNFEIIGKTINSGIIRWNSAGLPAGIYFVELNVGGYKRVEKVILRY